MRIKNILFALLLSVASSPFVMLWPPTIGKTIKLHYDY